MPLSTILISLVILFVIATVPIWPYSRAWGFWPSGNLGLIEVVLAGHPRRILLRRLHRRTNRRQVTPPQRQRRPPEVSSRSAASVL